MIADAFKDDNSFYSPATRLIKYGAGGVDDAEDGDVVTHEYGHSIQDAQDRGFGTSLGAGSLGEGFGDFVSAVNTSITPDLPNYADVRILHLRLGRHLRATAAPAWLPAAGWWTAPMGSARCLRRTPNAATTPTATARSGHTA